MSRRCCFWIATALLVLALGAAVLTGVAAEYAATLNYEQGPGFHATFGFRVSQVVQGAGPAAIVTVLLLLGALYFLYVGLSVPRARPKPEPERFIEISDLSEPE